MKINEIITEARDSIADQLRPLQQQKQAEWEQDFWKNNKLPSKTAAPSLPKPAGFVPPVKGLSQPAPKAGRLVAPKLRDQEPKELSYDDIIKYDNQIKDLSFRTEFPDKKNDKDVKSERTIEAVMREANKASKKSERPIPKELLAPIDMTQYRGMNLSELRIVRLQELKKRIRRLYDFAKHPLASY